MAKPVTTEYTSDTTSGTVLWCGTEASYEAYVQGSNAIRAGLVAGTLDLKAFSEDDNGQSAHLLQRSGNVGIITIAGSLTNDDSPFNKYFGLVSYGEIGRALQAAVSDPAIKVIATNYGTGGGAVNGVHDLATTIKLVSDTMKPVHTYTGSAMASAGLWLGASGKTISVGPTAVVGSIGILQVHTETSKMMADMGVTKTVIRVGTHKALVNPHEPLTPVARAAAESLMGEIYSVFMGHVATARKTDYAKADAAYGQGKEFVGQQAVDIGLASQVTSFDKFIAGLQQQVDKSQGDPHNAGNYQRGSSMTRKALSEATVTAMKAAGCTDVQIDAADEAAHAANLKAEADAKLLADAAAKIAADAAIAAAQASNSTLSASALLEKITTQQAEVIKANTERDTAKAAVAPLQAQIDQCRAIISSSLNSMKIGLGGSASDMKSASIEELLKAHTETETAFKAKYPTGQVSATSAAVTEADKTDNEPSWARTASSVNASRAKA